MGYHTKRWFAQSVLNELENDKRSAIDFKIDEREVFIRLDAIVNQLAKENYFENWKLSGMGIDESFITTWTDIAVTDQDNSLPSYFTFPCNYITLPRNGGIEEIWPMKYIHRNQPSVVIISHRELRLFSRNAAAGMEGRLFGYPQGTKFYFGTCDVKKKYGNMGLRLVIRDSSQISLTDPYPIPADKEQFIIAELVKWFRTRQLGGSDSAKDNQDKIVP